MTVAVKNQDASPEEAKIAATLHKESFLEDLGDYIAGSAVAAMIALYLLTNTAQTCLSALAELIKKTTEQATSASEEEQDSLAKFIKENIDPYKDKTDQVDLNKLAENNKEYESLKAQWDTLIQKLQTDAQSLTQKQQSGQDNSKIYIQVAQDIIDIFNYLANIAR